MALVLKLASNTWENASRDKRELSVFRELGYDILVMAKGEEKDRGRRETVDGYTVLRCSTRPLGSKISAGINRIASMFTWTHSVRKLKPDVISAHDLLPCLIIAWMSTWFLRKKPKLIYDSHEFELGRNTGRPRSRFTRFVIGKTEKFLMKHCVLSIMVNDSIADEVQRIHKLRERPLVIRNVPEYWNIDPEVCRQTRQELMKQFIIPSEGIGFLVMYHGAIVPDRGIEQLLQILAMNETLVALVLGDGSALYRKKMIEQACQLNVEQRVVFHNAVPQTELWKYIGAADISFCMIDGSAKSYYYALPNKLFESIQAETPILASDFPEMERIIDCYGVGMTCQSSDLNAISACIDRLHTDQALYSEMKRNMKRAKADLCWEQEKNRLINAIQKTIS